MKNSHIFIQKIFGRHKPGLGIITIEKSRQKRTDDIKLAEYFVEKYGGDYVILSDIMPQGVKPPDILLTKRAVFENKRVSSISSIDSQTKKALSQLDKDNLSKIRRGLEEDGLKRVLVISVADNFCISMNIIKGIVLHRIARYSVRAISYIDYVIVKRKGSALYYFEAPKNPHK